MAVVDKSSRRTFTSGLTEHCVNVCDKHQVDAVVVKHVLRRLKPVVSTDKVVHGKQLNVTEFIHHQNIKHLSAAFIVLRTMSFTQLTKRI